MIVEIHKSSSSMSGTLQYNENKVRIGVASILCEHGIDSKEISVINRLFEDRERLSLREAQHLSFQMSVNPGPEDDISEEQIPDFVKDLMEGLGYGEQPWVIFRHEDTGRVHYHVVSTRIDSDGRKIRDYYEKRACDKLVKGLEEKYGYIKGRGTKKNMGKEMQIPVFRSGEGDVVRKIEYCLQHALTYRFTTERQFAEVMRCHGVLVREGLGKEDLKVHLSFQGLGDDGRPCTASVSDAKMNFDVRMAMEGRIEECDGLDVRHEKAGLMKTVSAALGKCDNVTSLIGALKSRGVDLIIYRDNNGIPRGSTLIDHKSACVFKGSELSRFLGAAILELSGNDLVQVDNGQEKAASSEFSESNSFNSGISEALSMLFDATMTMGSGQTGKDLEEKKDKKKKLKRRML